MLFMVIQEPKQKWRQAFAISMQFFEAETKAAAVRQATRLKDPCFKGPRAVEVRAGIEVWT